MSHVVDLKLQVKSLECLKLSAKALGMEMIKVPQFKWFGKHVGDYPLPAGFKKEDMGKCEYALRTLDKQAQGKMYEVGVCKRRDGKPGYTLLWDFWAGGYGLEEAIGKDGKKLKQQYAYQVAKKQLKEQGCEIEFKTKADGSMVLKARRAM